jgi:hypothetical protein
MTEIEELNEPLDMGAFLIDWFETIEEIELTEGHKVLLTDIAQSLEHLKIGAIAMGLAEVEFEDWLRLEVMEDWTFLLESEDLNTEDVVQQFHAFITQGEQRLYLQLMKRCAQIAESA